jgi:hypothetical protein
MAVETVGDAVLKRSHQFSPGETDTQGTNGLEPGFTEDSRVERMYGIRIERPEWDGFLALISRGSGHQRALVAVNSQKFGNRAEAEWLPFRGMAYDGQDDIIEIALGRVEHLVKRPREVYFAEEAGWFTGLAIIDSDGARHIVMLRETAMLPAE